MHYTEKFDDVNSITDFDTTGSYYDYFDFYHVISAKGMYFKTF